MVFLNLLNQTFFMNILCKTLFIRMSFFFINFFRENISRIGLCLVLYLVDNKFSSKSLAFFFWLVNHGNIFLISLCKTFVSLKFFFELNESGSAQEFNFQTFPKEESKNCDLISDRIRTFLTRKQLSSEPMVVAGWSFSTENFTANESKTSDITGKSDLLPFSL